MSATERDFLAVDVQAHCGAAFGGRRGRGVSSKKGKISGDSPKHLALKDEEGYYFTGHPRKKNRGKRGKRSRHTQEVRPEGGSVGRRR